MCVSQYFLCWHVLYLFSKWPGICNCSLCFHFVIFIFWFLFWLFKPACFDCPSFVLESYYVADVHPVASSYNAREGSATWTLPLGPVGWVLDFSWVDQLSSIDVSLPLSYVLTEAWHFFWPLEPPVYGTQLTWSPTWSPGISIGFHWVGADLTSTLDCPCWVLCGKEVITCTLTCPSKNSGWEERSLLTFWGLLGGWGLTCILLYLLRPSKWLKVLLMLILTNLSPLDGLRGGQCFCKLLMSSGEACFWWMGYTWHQHEVSMIKKKLMSTLRFWPLCSLLHYGPPSLCRVYF